MAPRAHNTVKGKAHNNSSSSRLLRLVKSAFTLYLLCAVVYTAFSFLVKPAINAVSGSSQELQEELLSDAQRLDHNETLSLDDVSLNLNGDEGDMLWGKAESKKAHGSSTSSHDRHAAIAAAQAKLSISKAKVGVEGTNWGVNKLNWHAPSDPLAHSSNKPLDAAAAQHLDRKPTPMAEDFFLSKAFGETLQPSKVIPYYYKASANHAEEDITITTLVTSNRFKVLAALVERYQGMYSIPARKWSVSHSSHLFRAHLGHYPCNQQ